MDIPEELLTASENDLYREIGRILNEDDRGALPPLARDLIERGKQRVDTTAASLQRRICTNNRIRTLAAAGYSTELVAAVAAPDTAKPESDADCTC